MPGGRPLKFKTTKELQTKIDEYFKSCWEEVWVEHTDQFGNSKGWFQKLDRNGDPILRLAKPYSITGLALYLETSRETLINYQEKEGFFDTIKKAKDRCENYLEEGMLSGAINPTASIFGLKNFGWRDKQETEVSGPNGGPQEVQVSFVAPK